MLKCNFKIELYYNTNYIIDRLTSYYNENNDYEMRKRKGFFIIDKRIKNIAFPYSRIGNKIQFKIERCSEKKSEIIGQIEPGTESKAFLVSLGVSLIIILSSIIYEFSNNKITSETIVKSLKWLFFIISFTLLIIIPPKKLKNNIKQEFTNILKQKKSDYNKFSEKNYCPKCNRIEMNKINKTCSKCGGNLTTIS